MPKKISEQKLKQIVDNYYNDVFFKLIAEYTNRLDAIQAEKKFLQKQYDFISLISHQLRTPISAIKLSLEIATQDIKDKTLADGINEKIKNLNALVNDLLFFLSVTDTDEFKKDDKFSLSQTIRENIARLKENFKKKKVSLKFKKPNFTTMARGDKKMTVRVVGYLLDNAITYNNKNGSVKISISRAAKNFLKVSIQDDGFGISQKDQGNVFEKFFRGSNASLGKNEGGGVNLHIAKKIVESWGGKIWFKSKENEGTIFYFTIPTANNKISK